MEELETKLIPFMGASLIAARGADGQAWAAIRRICEGIGLGKDQADGQIKNIQDDAVLSKGARDLVLNEGGYKRWEIPCLHLDYVPLWLARIPITPAMERESPGLAERLLEYQLHAKDAIAAAFMPEGRSPARGRDITARDCLKAASIVARCHEDRLPYVLGLLEEGGFDVSFDIPATEAAAPRCPLLKDLIDAAVDEYGISVKRIAQLTGSNRTQLYQYKNGRVPRGKRNEYLIRAILAEIDRAKAERERVQADQEEQIR